MTISYHCIRPGDPPPDFGFKDRYQVDRDIVDIATRAADQKGLKKLIDEKNNDERISLITKDLSTLSLLGWHKTFMLLTTLYEKGIIVLFLDDPLLSSTFTTLAQRLGMHQSNLNHYYKTLQNGRPKINWTEEKEREMITMIKEGKYPHRRIAEDYLGIGYSTMRRFMKIARKEGKL